MAGDVALFLQSLRFGEMEIGMLEFAADATKLVDIIPLDSNANLQTLLNAIPTDVGGGTCIGCGLITALEVNIILLFFSIFFFTEYISVMK